MISPLAGSNKSPLSSRGLAVSATVASSSPSRVPLLIGGRLEASASDRRGEVFNPSTGRVLAEVPFCTPAEIDHALDRLEMAARDRGVAVGISSALPVSVEHIARWAKGVESRGLLLVPITAVALKPKQS